MAVIPSFDERERYVRELAEFLAIPSVSGDGAPRDMRAAAEWVAARLAFAGGRVVETDGHPVVLGEWLGRAGRADDPRLRPLRRAAAGRRGRVGDAAVRAERARRPHLRAAARPTTRGRCSSRSRSPRRSSPQHGRAAAERPLPDRGRGGDRQPDACRPSCERTATSSPPTSSSPPTARCGGRASRRSRSPPRGWLALDIDRHRADAPTSTRAATAAPSQNPIHALAAILAGLHDAGRRASRSRASTTASRARARPTARDRARRRSTRRPTARASACPALHGEPGYTHARAAVDAAHAGGERHRGRRHVHRHPAAARRAHITCRLVPGQDPERGPRGDRPHSRGARAAGRRGARRRRAGRGAGLRDRGRPPGDPGRRPRRSRTSTPARSRCSCASAGRCRRPRCSSRCSARRRCSSRSRRPTSNLHAPNEFFRLQRLRGGHARLGRALDAAAPGPPDSPQSSSSCSAASMNCCDAGSSGAMWPQDDGIARHSAFVMWRTSYSASTGGK